MRTLDYALKGKDVPAHLSGTVIRIKQAENYTEAEALTKKGQSDVVEKFNDGYGIALQGLLRGKSAKEGATVEQLQTLADGYQYTERVEGEGVARESKPATKLKNASAEVGNKLFEQCEQNEKLLGQMVRAGVVNQAAFDAWREARTAVQAEQAAKAAPAAAQ